MTPYYTDPWLTVYAGDNRDVLATLPDESVHCVVTSPPYWGLRDYGAAGQLGLEPTPEQYVENMVAVFREVRRVLRRDGTLWLNLGDSYAGSASQGGYSAKQASNRGAWHDVPRPLAPGLKPKDLVGIPWRVAFALQADGWYLRSDIIWAKPNPMPESVTDRPTKSHEYLFLLAKSERYYFDADAVREAHTYDGTRGANIRESLPLNGEKWATHKGLSSYAGAGRNIRSVWTIATQPHPGAHFAVFPPALVEPCIKAGTSERGVCPECGAPWRRVVERGRVLSTGGSANGARASNMATVSPLGQDPERSAYNTGAFVEREHITTGWQPSCAHKHHDYYQPVTPVPATVLDPFAGSGTVGMVAQRLSRRAILIDLNPSYIEQQLRRNRDVPLGLVG